MSSKEQMEKSFELLSQLKQVEVPSSVYENVLNKIEAKKKDTISLNWIQIAAAVLIFLTASEVYLIKSNTLSNQKSNTIELISQTDNMLYHE